MHEVKRRALTAARDIVEHHGLKALTFRALEDATSMSAPRIIYHFKTRDNLIYELAQYALQSDNRRVLGYIVASDHPSVASLPASRRRQCLASLV